MIKHAIAAALAVTATHSSALSLGGTLGNAIIGRPLDLVVKSSIEPAEAAAGLCLEAELLYGDSRLPASAVSVSIHRLGTDGSGALRVRSSVPVNEPVVTLVVKAGCGNRFTRSYALLADYLQKPAESAAPAREQATPRVRDVLEPARARQASGRAQVPASTAERADQAARHKASSARSAGERESPIRLQPAQPRPAGLDKLLSKHRPASAEPVPDQPEKATVQAVQAATAESSGSRLKLDLVDLKTSGSESEKGANQGLPGAAGTMPSGIPPNAAARPDAGADQALSEPQRMQDMLRELEGLRSEQEKMRAAVEAVNAQLARTSGPRYLDPLVLGLLGVCAAALSALAWLWTRLRRQQQRADRALLDEAWRLSSAASAPAD